MEPSESMETVNRTYRYRLYPTRRQVAALEAQLQFNCDLYNAALEQRRTAWKRGGVTIRLKQQLPELKEVRKDGPEMSYTCQEMALQRLDLAFEEFFRSRRGYPRFKPTSRYNTLSWRTGRGGYTVGDRLRIMGVGHIKVRWHRPLDGEVRQLRITRKNGRWYAAFAVRQDKPAPRKETGRQVGIDLGVTSFVTTSDGDETESVRARRANEKPVRRQQRKVARCQRGSNRRRKEVARLARMREQEANRRRDQCHKLSRELVDAFDLIAHEDLRINQMVRGNRGLNREIHEQGWAMLLTFLGYKAESAGVEVIAVDPRYTSQTCAECGAVDPASRKRKRYDCTSCGHSDDADVNAARNILSRSARTGPSGANATSDMGVVRGGHQ